MNSMTIKASIVRILWGNFKANTVSQTCQVEATNDQEINSFVPQTAQRCNTQHPSNATTESFNLHYMKALPLLWSSSYVEYQIKHAKLFYTYYNTECYQEHIRTGD